MSETAKQNTPSAERPRLQDTIRLSAQGFAKVLGDLEARVMQAVWDLGRPASARVVHERVIREHEVALLTVITVLNKLVEKRLLRRHKQDDLLHYEAAWSEEDFRAHAARRVVEGILSFGPAALASSFIDALAEHDPDQLAELERMIHERMQREER
ncbi:BlaI/MecI/CopY family transcriptional regulator [Longimicrobium sp.]|uniref:BlaI/MecI/CopY family transcriptional regulator n=1 Tax=Longimicrobium sp. TaxID=2029185 RepID=UPI002E36D24A|nr:BlaI/MecI/CopY family transcriptional regulator [Longimicrobium sp.]HEX6041908.1 BlaI/MecI/CopY family transcriptional regulator [Longimicrobium sp.]